MEFLTDTALHDAIVAITRESGARCAVAFWGKGAETRVGDDARIICNLKMGGTNPAVIEKLMQRLGSDCVRQHDSLHAKVYIGRESAIITSANASANGLGFEGTTSTWQEAGVRVREVSTVEKWFTDLWKRGTEITDEDLKAAKEAWKNRQRNLPTLTSFENFDVDQDRLPWVTYYQDATWIYNDDEISEQGLTLNKTLKHRIDDGAELHFDDEKDIIQDRWFLHWRTRNDGAPAQKIDLYWKHVGNQIVRGGFIWKGEETPSDVILASEDQPPVPFAINKLFEETFRQTISQKKFELFTLDDEENERWYRDREDLLRSFWKDLKVDYISLMGK